MNQIMKFLTFAFLLSFLFPAKLMSQDKSGDFYLGISTTFHTEERSRTIYGPGWEERQSINQYFGYGIRAGKKILKSWEVTLGLNYVTREYRMSVPFDHCSLQPGQPCAHILMHTDRYGYRNIEGQLGINKYVLQRKKWDLFLSGSVVTASSLSSYYRNQFNTSKKFENRSQNRFGTSWLGGMGIGYKPNPGIKFTLEPFVRIAHEQRIDPIIITGHEEARSSFDNYGVVFTFWVGI
ncbi:hypothetical protein CLW00_10574 [Mongoliibacter ruber]|uniref:Outer membrane protein with beta-barrel domain n=2 Tax=Mongoliibacter ruber TaxID=1750599 RepID=A0A2T0WN68_9BACT|nr:hypothetical protein CLW00_10574 [Mongoliibacter ruber]